MSAPVRFLNTLAQTLATMSLYAGSHPARVRAIDTSYDALVDLQRDDPSPRFSFLGDDVIYGQYPLHDMKDWPWAARLAAAGVQRIEFVEAAGREEYGFFVEDVLARLSRSGAEGTAVAPLPPASAPRRVSIRYGALGLRGDDGASDGKAAQAQATAAGTYSLDEEIEAIAWLHEQVMARGTIPVTEADAVVRSLSIAMRCDSVLVIPLIRLKAADQYAVFHSINVAVLAMAFANYLGLPDRDTHDLGMAGLLHDLGMARVPRELLLKPEPLTDAEWAIVRRHPAEGARLILGSNRALDLAATVAYEHHVRPDGTGYPTMRFPRECHFASKLVRVCDVYNALRSERHYRRAWMPEDALRYVDEHAGVDGELDPELAAAFTSMMRGMGQEGEGASLPMTQGAR